MTVGRRYPHRTTWPARSRRRSFRCLADVDITSTVEEVDAPNRIVWGGPAQGTVAVHRWTLQPQGAGVLVRTQESWEGDPVDAQVDTLQSALDKSLRDWLENLKGTAEAEAQD